MNRNSIIWLVVILVVLAFVPSAVTLAQKSAGEPHSGSVAGQENELVSGVVAVPAVLTVVNLI